MHSCCCDYCAELILTLIECRTDKEQSFEDKVSKVRELLGKE